MLQPKLLVKVLALLNENQIDYMITGSFVSSIQGEPRATHDADLLDEPFDQSRFARKYEEKILGFSMKISAPEDTILMKLRWAKLSGGSEKQFTDALRVYEVQYQNLDLNYMEAWSQTLQIKELWKKLKQQAQPIT